MVHSSLEDTSEGRSLVSRVPAWLEVRQCSRSRIHHIDYALRQQPHSGRLAACCTSAFLAVGQEEHLVKDCMHFCRTHRRKTMVVQQSVELVLQSLNVALYLIPNVYSLVQKCSWGSHLVGAHHGLLKTDPRMFAFAMEYRPCLCRSMPAL